MAQFAFYFVVVTLGVLSMGFQLLGSRLLSPHFGSSVVVWAWLISTFLAAFSAGSMLGGWISNLPAERRTRGQWLAAGIAVASLAFTALAGKATLLAIEAKVESIGVGLGVACVCLFFVPVTALSCFGPMCVQHLAAGGTPPGQASGLVYGVSTLGNIAGVMLTAFVLIPHVSVSMLLYGWLAVAAGGLAALIGLMRTSAKT